MTELSEWISMSGNMMMYIAGLAMLAAILFDRSRDERKKISVQAMISALLLWYLSWLIG